MFRNIHMCMRYLFSIFKRFGCDNQLNGQVLDECGVCGGDNSTCIVIANTDTEQQNQGETLVVMKMISWFGVIVLLIFQNLEFLLLKEFNIVIKQKKLTHDIELFRIVWLPFLSGERRTLAVLPAGTFNIQFWFPYKEMADNYLGIISTSIDSF